MADGVDGEGIGGEEEGVEVVDKLGDRIRPSVVLSFDSVDNVENHFVPQTGEGQNLCVDVEEERLVEPSCIADRSVTEILGGHGDPVPCVFEGREVDDFGQPFGDQLSEVGFFAVKNMLVEVGKILRGLYVGPIKDVSVETIFTQVVAVLAEPAAVVVALPFGGALVDGLECFDPDPRETRRREAGVLHHRFETVPNHYLFA